MKKIVTMILLLVLINSYLPRILANDETEKKYPDEYESYEQYINDPDYFSNENQKKIKIKLDEVKNNPINLNSRAAVRLTPANYLQEKSYWCGPASVQIVLKHETGVKYSQATLAANMGTTSSNGTYVYRIVDELNSKMSANGKAFRFVSQLNSTSNYWNNMIYTTNNNHMLIYNVEKETLNSNYLTTGGHYIVGTGYATDNSTIYSVYYYDPYTQSDVTGNRATTKSVMNDAINAQTGYYIW